LIAVGAQARGTQRPAAAPFPPTGPSAFAQGVMATAGAPFRPRPPVSSGGKAAENAAQQTCEYAPE